MDFSDWLLEQMSEREWSQSDLARYSGLTRQAVSDYVNRRRTNPDPDALVSISKAFGISPITVFRKAGLLPDAPDEQVLKDDWAALLANMHPDDIAEIREIIDLKIRRRKDAEQAARAANFKPGKQPG